MKELELFFKYSVKSIVFEFLVNEFKHVLNSGKDPVVKGILEHKGGAFGEDLILEEEFLAVFVLESINLLDDESHELIPRKEDVFDKSMHSFVFKLQVLSLNQWRVHQV